MTAAGFALQTDGDDPVLQHGPCDPVPLRLRCVRVRVCLHHEENDQDLVVNLETVSGHGVFLRFGIVRMRGYGHA